MLNKMAICTIIAMLVLAPLVPLASYASKNVHVSIPKGSSNYGYSGPYFSPEIANITVGDVVTWTNNDLALHTVTSGDGNTATPDGVFDSNLTLAPGKTFSYTFNNPGTYPYFDHVHPWMHGTIVVTMFVLPESPVGLVALIASSLGALGAFTYIKKRRKLKGQESS